MSLDETVAFPQAVALAAPSSAIVHAQAVYQAWRVSSTETAGVVDGAPLKMPFSGGTSR